jgi:predicted secreted hydrolase
MAHAAITDIEGNQHVKMERFARGALGLAGNRQSPFRVWLDNWQLASELTDFPWTISISDKDFSIKLTVTPQKQMVLQGDKGLSQKSPAPGNASYYFSYTRLKTEGQLTVGGNSYAVSGLSWFDREWGTSLLADDQSGWDWFALQFDSGHDLMYYQLRDNNGLPHPNSLGSWVNTDGQSITIRPQDIRLKPVKWWTSPDGTKYPVHWELHYLPGDRRWQVRAAIESQLMDVSVQYWEGAVTIHDPESNSVIGKGYLEMTGY